MPESFRTPARAPGLLALFTSAGRSRGIQESLFVPSTLKKSVVDSLVINKESTTDFFKVLGTNKDSWIPRDLPADVKRANKPGALAGVRNDSGIVFVEGGPYVICVLTAFLTNEREGEQPISNVSFTAWRMFDRLNRAPV